MAELADALDLGSSGYPRAGSSPVIRTIEEKALLFIRRAFFYHEYSRRKYSGFVKDNEANLNQNQQKFRSAGGFIPVYTIRLERERFLLYLFILQKDIFSDIFLHFLYIFAIFLQNLRIFDDILQPGFSSRPSPPYDINELQRRWFYESKLD